MSKKNLYVLGIALTLILGAFFYQKFCCNATVNLPMLNDSIDVGSSKAILDPFIIQGENFDYRCIDNIKFVKNGFVAVTPFADSVAIGFEKLKSELASNPNEMIRITGYATSDEKNTSTYPNLALARANDIKNYFVTNGFKDNQFELNGVIKDKWQMVSDTLVGPVSFEIVQNKKTSGQNNDWLNIKETINANPLIMYFDTNKSSENLSTDEQNRIAEIANYIKNVPDAMVSVIGHTDNVGSVDLNRSLGQTRADFAKKQLIKQGIDSSKIETSSQGSDTPIADNSTAEGKTKNRRTVITIK
jgi:OmpA-OmpF porin, OOP family